MLLASLPFYPLLSFLLLITFGKKLSWQLAAIISVSSMALTVLASTILLFELSASENQILNVNLWHWFDLNHALGKSQINLSFYLCLLYTSPSPRD